MTFKKGDRVRYIGHDTPDLHGQIGTVTDRRQDLDDESVPVEWDSGIAYPTSVCAYNLAKLMTPVEIEIGKEYRLLPNSRRRDAPTRFNDDVTRVRVVSGPDSDGDYDVIALNGTRNKANHKVGVDNFSYVLPEFLAPLEEEKVEMTIEVGKEYRLLPNARRKGAPTIFNDDVTRVRVRYGPDSDGDCDVVALNGTNNDVNHKVGVGHRDYILLEFLAPLEEDSPADNTATAELLAEIKQLQQQLANAKALHESDVQTIGQALIEAANGDNYRSGSRWCSEYDDAIEEVNRNLAVKLPLREQEWDVEIYFHSYSARVTATTAEEAEAEARRRFEQGDIEPNISSMEADYA